MQRRFTTPTWDDLRAPASGINPVGQASPPTVDATDGTLVFAAGATNVIAIQFQLPHTWKVGTAISPHVHWKKTTSAEGTVKWQMKYIWTNIGEVDEAFSAFADSTEMVPSLDTANLHALAEFADLAGTGKTISSMLTVILQRLSSGAEADTYAADVKLLEVDIHY